MARCIQSTKALTDFDYLDANGRKEHEDALAKYIHDVGYILSIRNGEEDHLTGNTVLSAAQGDRYVDLMLTKVLGITEETANKHLAAGGSLWDMVRDMSPEQREMVVRAVDTHLAEVFKASDKPDRVKELCFESCRAKSIINWTSSTMAWSNKLSAATAKLMRLVGGNKPMVENKINVLQHYDPARKMFLNLNEIETFAERQGKLQISDLNKAFEGIAKADILWKNGITQIHLSSMMEYFSGIKDIDNIDVHAPRFIEFAKAKGLMGDSELDEQNSKAIYRKVAEGVKYWWKLNYGQADGASANRSNEYVEQNGVRVWKHTDGIAGYFNTLRNKFTEGMVEYQRIIEEKRKLVGHEDTAKDKALKDFFNKLQTHFYKDNYIPMSRDTEFIEDFAKTDEEFHVWYADWMFKSKDTDLDEESKIDFLKNISDNVLVTNQIFKKFSQVMTARALEAQLDIESTKGDGNWFASRDRRDIRVAVESLIDDLNLKADYTSATQSIGARTVKAIGNLVQTFVGSYIMFPGSALSNYIGFSAAVALRSGKKVSGAEFNRAINNPNSEYYEIAKQIDEYADKFLISAGMPDQFVSYAKAEKPGHGDLIDRINAFAGKAGNVISQGGPLSLVSKSLTDYLTVGGSEKKGKAAFIKRHIFNQVIGEMSLLKLGHEGDIPKDVLDAVVNKSIESSWYEITSAMGLFSGLNKSFYLQTKVDTATTVPAALLGMALKVRNSFRHVAITGFDNYIASGINFGNAAKLEGLSVAMRNQGGAAFLATTATVLSMILAIFKNRDSIMFSPLNALNPIDSPISGLKMLATQCACLLGADVSKENYDMVMEDGLNYLVGAAGGRYAADMYSRQANNMLKFYSDPFTATYNIVSNGEIAGYSGNLYKARQGLRDSFGFLLASDPIFLVERAVELGFIRSTDKGASDKFFVDTAKSTLSTMLGISLYSMPDFHKKIKKQYDDDTRIDRQLSYLRSGKRGGRDYIKHLYSKDVTDRAEFALENYGRMPRTRKI